MGLFKNKEGAGFMDVIRCDEKEYLVWKWRPSGEANSTRRENAIRFGSSLRVKDGEVAVFVYKQKSSETQDFIVGPFDQMITTANLPIIASIIGLAYAGGTPFQAEVYFINLAGNIQVRFGIPYFDIFDPRFLDFAVPTAAHGTITFNITDYKNFIKLNRLINFELEDFNRQIKDAVTKYIKGVMTNIPQQMGIPALQMERKLLEINDAVAAYLKPRLVNDFGVNVKGFDLASIEFDKESDGYRELRKMTAEQTSKTVIAQTDTNIKNLRDLQAINADNMTESLRIQREEAQRLQRLRTESTFIGAHALDKQAEVLRTAAENLGKMGSVDLGGGSGAGGGAMNPAGMMTGMMMGGAMGGQMANMMNQVGQRVQQQQNMPPPPPSIQYNLSINGQTLGPFDMQQLGQMAMSGQLTKETFAWRQGMAGWEKAGSLPELATLFQSAAPPPPPPSAPIPPPPVSPPPPPAT